MIFVVDVGFDVLEKVRTDGWMDGWMGGCRALSVQQNGVRFNTSYEEFVWLIEREEDDPFISKI